MNGNIVETPIELNAGVSGRRERLWGVIGGVIGATVGVTSALIAVLVEHAPWYSTGGSYPAFFRQPRLLTYDVFLAVVMGVGAAFLISSVVISRTSRFPRTDTSGATLVGAILALISGLLLFMRLVAIVSAAG
jgi:hypothetical protein